MIIRHGEIEDMVWRNPINFFAQSGRIRFFDFEDGEGCDRRKLHQRDSVLRGQKSHYSLSTGLSSFDCHFDYSYAPTPFVLINQGIGVLVNGVYRGH